MAVAVLTILIELPGSMSLKEKRTRLKPLISRLHREFNISVAEIDRQDSWNQATIGCALISNDRQFSETSLHAVIRWLAKNWPDISIIDDHIEIIS